MEINFSARSRYDNDRLLRMAKIMDDNTDLFSNQLDAQKDAIKVLWLLAQAQSECIDNLNDKVDYLETQLRNAIHASLPPKYQIPFMRNVATFEKVAKESYERINNEITADYTNRVKNIGK